ncbi:hypothetical protein F5Y12DRAFT_709629 [Xylaria sp. FL1777]|nr:hypothetical protein F5Y12DRAFT_709629 [Xylaria sp. FL1777]
MSSGTRAGQRIAKINLSSPYCYIEVIAWRYNEDGGRIELRFQLQHANDASKCKCRVNPDPAQESRNDEILLSHVYNLPDVDGALMASVFAKLKIGFSALEPEHVLPWDGDKKVWVMSQQ